LNTDNSSFLKEIRINHFCWRPLFIKGGANGFDHNTIFTSLGLQPVSLQPVVQGVVQGVEAVPQQVSPPLFPLVSVPLWLCTQSPLRQY